MAGIVAEPWKTLTPEEAKEEFNNRIKAAGYKSNEEYLDDVVAKYGAVDPLFYVKGSSFNNGRTKELGKISKLIADMAIKGATEEEIKAAIKYSMILIDAEKHNLDYIKAKKDLKIDEINEKYGSSGRYAWQ